MEYSCNGILLTNVCNNINNLKQYAEQKKLDIKEYVLYDFICREKSNL